MQAKDYRKKIRQLILEENLLLPDFQRDFVWKPQDQQLKLACSLFLDIPIGSILVLDKLDKIGLRKLCYKKEKSDPELRQSKLLMDGQQRISTIKSIFSDLYNNMSEWREVNDCLHNNLRYKWFLDLSLNNLPDDKLEQKLKLLYDFYWNKKFEDYDIEDLKPFITNKKILVKNKNERWHPSQRLDIIKNYCSEQNLLPLFLILSSLSNLMSIIEKISDQYIDFLIEKKSIKCVEDHISSIKKSSKMIIENEKARSEIINRITVNITEFFNDHIIHKEIYGVEYEKSQLNKAIVAFNTMNTGGISLGVFDIVSAKYSKLKKGRLSKKLLEYAESSITKIDDQSVSRLIEEKFIKDDKNLITKNFSDMYLNMLSIFIKETANNGQTKLDWIKQKSLLQITAEQIENNSEKAVKSLILAFQFLIEKCGVPSINDIRYKLIIIPIAYNLYKNKDKKPQEKKIIEKKTEYSYWVKLFAGQYEKGQNASSIDHLNHLISFIKNSSNEFKKYENDLCNKKGYSDWDGFRSFYEETSHSYSTNIGECFLQFILAVSYANKVDIFKNDSKNKKIKIDHFDNLHKDHIIPSSWISRKKKKHPIHSVLNQFYSPSKRNQKRLNNPIDQEITREGMKELCIDTGSVYSKEEFSEEDKIKKFLGERFEQFKEKLENHINQLKREWK